MIVMSNPQGERRGEARASAYNARYRQRRFSLLAWGNWGPTSRALKNRLACLVFYPLTADKRCWTAEPLFLFCVCPLIIANFYWERHPLLGQGEETRILPQTYIWRKNAVETVYRCASCLQRQDCCLRHKSLSASTNLLTQSVKRR